MTLAGGATGATARPPSGTRLELDRSDVGRLKAPDPPERVRGPEGRGAVLLGVLRVAGGTDGRRRCSSKEASCGMSRSGRQSSKPSRHASESPVTAPVPILRAISSRRMGPTGTSLMATCHSSAAAGGAAGAEARSEPASWPSLPTFLRKSAPSAEGRPVAAATESAEGAGALAGTRAPLASAPAALAGTAAAAFLGTAAAGAGAFAGTLAGARAGTLALATDGTGAGPGTATGAGLEAGAAAGGTTLGATPAPRIKMSLPHLRHVMRSVRPETFSSGIWYFALQLSQRNFIECRCLGSARRGGQSSAIRCSLMPCRVSSSGELPSARSHISMALYLNPAR